jgi:hypothetical protein
MENSPFRYKYKISNSNNLAVSTPSPVFPHPHSNGYSVSAAMCWRSGVHPAFYATGTVDSSPDGGGGERGRVVKLTTHLLCLREQFCIYLLSHSQLYTRDVTEQPFPNFHQSLWIRFPLPKVSIVLSVPFGSLRFLSVPFGSFRLPSVPFGYLRFPSVPFGSLRLLSVPFRSFRFPSLQLRISHLNIA